MELVPPKKSTQRGERCLRVRELGFPIRQTLLVFGEDGGRNFCGEVRVRQLLLHLHDFGMDLFHFFREADFFGGDINQAFERQK